MKNGHLLPNRSLVRNIESGIEIDAQIRDQALRSQSSRFISSSPQITWNAHSLHWRFVRHLHTQTIKGPAKLGRVSDVHACSLVALDALLQRRANSERLDLPWIHSNSNSRRSLGIAAPSLRGRHQGTAVALIAPMFWHAFRIWWPEMSIAFVIRLSGIHRGRCADVQMRMVTGPVQPNKHYGAAGTLLLG